MRVCSFQVGSVNNTRAAPVSCLDFVVGRTSDMALFNSVANLHPQRFSASLVPRRRDERVKDVAGAEGLGAADSR